MKKWMSFLVCVLMVVSMCMTVYAEPEQNVVLEEHNVTMEPELTENGQVRVWIYDAVNGNSIHGWIINLYVDGNNVGSYTVDSTSSALIDYDFPADKVKVECESYEGPCMDTVFYKADVIDITELVYAESQPTTESTDAPEDTETTDVPEDTQSTSADETQTTAPSEQTETTTTAAQSTTDSMHFGSYATMTSNDGRVGIGVAVDNGLVNATQLTAESLVINTCLWMDMNSYATLRAISSDSILLEMQLDSNAGSKSRLIAAKNADPRFSSYADSEVYGFAFSMVPVFLDENDELQMVNLEYLPESGKYELEMLVPESLKNCETIAVSVCSTEGLTKLYDNVRQGDKIRFAVSEFQTMAIVGFGQVKAEKFNVLILIFVIGGLLIVAGVAILIFVSFRRKKAEKQEEEDPENEVAHISLVPTSMEELEDESEMELEDEVAKILMDYDEQTDLTVSEREQYRAKASNDDKSFETIAEKSVSPARQMGKNQIETIRRSSEKMARASQDLSVDDLLDELSRDLDDLGTE